MKEVIDEYTDARIKLVKSLRKMNYRLPKKVPPNLWDQFHEQKKDVYRQLKKMDKVIGEIIK